MSSKKNFRTYTMQLLAGQVMTLQADGNMFAVTKSSSAFNIVFDESNRVAGVEQGMGGEFGASYSRVEIISETAQEVVVVLGFGRLNDGRASISGEINATFEGANSNTQKPVVVIAANSAAQLVAANANRKSVRLAIDSAQPNGVFLGKADIAINQGGFLDVGMIDYLDTTGALHAYNDSDSPVTVTVLELERI